MSNELSYHSFDQNIDQKIADLIKALHKNDYFFLFIPGCTDEEVVAIASGTRLDSGKALSMLEKVVARSFLSCSTMLGSSVINQAVLRLDDAICSFERETNREYVFMMQVQIDQRWQAYASFSGKPTFPSDFGWEEVLQFGLQLRAKGH